MAPGGKHDPSEQCGDGGPHEAASYLEVAIGEMAQLARRHRLDMLGYLLEMAYLEAGEQVRLRQRRTADPDAGTNGAAKPRPKRAGQP